MKKHYRHLTPEQVALMGSLYPDHSNEEVALQMGLSVFTVKSRAERHGWHKPQAYKSNLYREVAIRCNNADRINTPEAYAKRNETRRKSHASERVRIKWGLPQLTNRHYRIEPRERLLHRNRLERLGYIVDKDKLIAYYTPQTKRAVRIEKVPRGKKVGSIRGWYDFAPLPEENLADMQG